MYTYLFVIAGTNNVQTDWGLIGSMQLISSSSLQNVRFNRVWSESIIQLAFCFGWRFSILVRVCCAILFCCSLLTLYAACCEGVVLLLSLIVAMLALIVIVRATGGIGWWDTDVVIAISAAVSAMTGEEYLLDPSCVRCQRWGSNGPRMTYNAGVMKLISILSTASLLLATLLSFCLQPMVCRCVASTETEQLQRKKGMKNPLQK
jgi:hypothetical protein